MAKEKAGDDGVLVSAAKAVGSVAGSLASLVGVKTEAAPAARVRAGSRPGRFVAKNKSRLPRKVKKKLQTQAAKAN